MNNFGLDLKNMQILYQLDLNSRKSFSSIGKKTRLSPEVVFHRVKKLQENGTIKYFYTIINPIKLGFQGFRLYIKFSGLGIEKEKEILDFLIKHKKTWWVVKVQGKWDIDILLWVKDTYDFENFWNEFKDNYLEFISEYLLTIFTELYHFNKAYLVSKKRGEEKTITFGKSLQRNPKIDELDWKILKSISVNARKPTIEIAREVNSFAKIVAYRVKKMVKEGIILGFKPLIDLEKIGMKYFKLDINLKNMKTWHKLVSFSQSCPNITYVDQTIGTSDFEADIEAESNEKFYSLIQEIRAKFGENIRDYSYFVVEKIYKISYLPHKY